MSKLYITAKAYGSKTIITDCSFTNPLKVARPIYHDNFTEVIQMTASAGLLEGDKQDIKIDVGENAHLRFTSQSYTKIFKAGEYGAIQNVSINVHPRGYLMYLPCPVIPFAGSKCKCTTEIYLGKGSHFFCWDILSCGRGGMGERFAWNSYCTRMTVYLDSQPVFLDMQRYIPHIYSPAGIGFFEGSSHIGTAYIYGEDDISIPENCNISKTKALEGTCVRCMGNSAEEILGYFRQIKSNGGNSSWLVF